MISQDHIDSALKALKRESVAHDHFVRTLEQAVIEASYSLSGMVHILTGPPGSVMTLGRAVATRLRARSHPFNPFDAIAVTARPPLRKEFNWNGFFKEALKGLEQPIVGQTRRATESPRGITDFHGTATFRSAEDNREDFRLAMQGRMTRTLVVLNAHHILAGIDSQDQEAQIKPLSVFSDLAGESAGFPSCVILTGEPALLKMGLRSAESDLLSRPLAMPAYAGATDENDVKTFVGLLMAYEEMLKTVIQPKTLVSKAKEIRDRTHGTDAWIRRALWCAVVLLRPGDKPLAWDGFEKHLPTTTEALVIGRYSNSDSSSESAPATPTGKSVDGRSHNRRPGTRGPASDPVGLPS